MKLKRLLAAALALCMLLPFALPGEASAVEDPVSAEDLTIDKLNGGDYDIDLTKNGTEISNTALDEEIIDAGEEVRVIIVMEGDSIIEEDSSAVPGSETDAKVEALEENQAAVVSEIEETVLEGQRLDVTYSYTWLLNGVAATVPYGAIADIEAVNGVKQVLIQPVYTICQTETTGTISYPMTMSAGEMIGRETAWAQGYTGEGMKIAVIDSGLDSDHPNFGALPEDKLTETSATRETVEAVLGSLNASSRYPGLTVDDVYYSTKVAFGFNYCDDNLIIDHDNPSAGDHGSHVAGIAAANKVEGSDVVGVAPDAQLYIMKVFGVNGGAATEDILAALEDAILLGADVVNMSLGSPAGYTSDSAEIDEIYNRAAETGIVLSVSAGNSYTLGYDNAWGTDENLTSNPDNAVVASPATYVNVLSVASVENAYYPGEYISVGDYAIGYSDGSYGSNALLNTLAGLEFGIVAVPGYGEAADYEGLDVEGKIALVQRGMTYFSEKCQNAQDNGAIACLIYNNVSGALGLDLSDCTATIPCASISMANGAYILSALEENPDLTVTIGEGETLIPSETAYQISEFSSWGPSPDLSLEPDITAPGGNIYSTLDGGTYGLMSGTSMAAPNVAGISALVVQYLKQTEGLTGRELQDRVKELLMSTSSPLIYSDGLYYSPRSQGSGMASAYGAVNTQAYLTVDGSDTPKAELGDDPQRTGSYNFSFDVNNFGTTDLFYDLNTVVQTEDVDETYGDLGLYFMSSTPRALAAAADTDSASMVLTYDVDDDGKTGSHDAYLIYQAAVAGAPVDENWSDVSFRYNVDGNEAVDAGDVQAYLDALVGNDSSAHLENTVLRVAAGSSASVSVSVILDDADKEYFDTYYENGCYVEGYTFLTALNASGVDLSLPYLAFYGGWDEAPIIDSGFYWDSEEELAYNQYVNILWTQFGYYDGQPGLNPYVDEEFDPSHISLSPNGDYYFDNIEDIYVSLLRNAAQLSVTYTGEDGVVYFEDVLENIPKSCYADGYGVCLPFIYSWYSENVYNLTDENGETLPNNTKLTLSISASIDYEGARTDTWEIPITVDTEAPELLAARKLKDLDTGAVTLELTFRDNLSASVVALLSSDGNTIYAMDSVDDVEPDENGYQNYTVSYDITGLSGKLMVILSDYAVNEAYYGINVGGEGTPYGDFVAYQYNFYSDTTGWVSFNEDVEANETQISMDEMNFVCAEYVNGYVFAQTETGALYGFRYEDMLADTLEPEYTFIAQLENVYQDLAYSYAEGKLYGLYTYEEDWYGELYAYTEVYSINLKGAYYDEDLWMDMEPYQEDWVVSRGGLYGLSLACDDEGSLYILGTVSEEVYDEETGEYSYVESTAQLWKSSLEEDWWGDLGLSAFRLVGDTGLSMDYLQSMTWDHNTEQLYWARFDINGWYPESELIRIDPETMTEDEEGNSVISCELVGYLSGETCALFAPLNEETAAKAEHANVPEMDSSVVGRPVLRDSMVTMNVGGVKKLTCDFDPWYTDHKDVVWSSDNTDVVTVDDNGVITAVGKGTAVITAAAKDDESKFDTCTVEVTALSLKFEGIISAQSAGIGNVTGVSTYEFVMNEGVPTFGTVNAITAADELNFGLSLATSAYGRGSIWACEYGNTGMIYEIDPETGEVKDVLEPIDGEMLFGLTYSEATDTFTGIMNMHLFVDIPMTHDDGDQMLESYDEQTYQFTWHNINMLPYLLASNTGFVTGESGNGASSEIVFCGITSIDGGIPDSYGDTYYYDTYKDYLGNWAFGGSVNYQPTQTLVLLDNVGRLWYIDEIAGMTLIEDNWGNQFYESADGESSINGSRNGVIAQEITDQDGNTSYSVFYIRQILETPLTDMFREGTMPRITYHFSDIEFAGFAAEGDPIFAMSLYDYWNNGTTNELYLYIPGHETDEWDYETYEPIWTPDRLFDLGDTGKYNIIASIHSAEVTGGLDAAESGEDAGTEGTASVNTLAVGRYTR